MRLLILLTTLLLAQFVHAGAVITYHGRLIAPTGDPVVSSNVSFNIRVLSPQTMGSCVLYEEQRTLNMSASDGVFVIPIGDGSGVRTSNDPGFQIEKVFTNSAGTVFNKPSAWDSSKYFCNSGSSYTPSSLDGRQLVVSFKDGSGAWQVLPNMDVTFVPFAVSSYDAQNIGGTPSASVLRVAGSSAAPLSSADYVELQKLIDGSSASFGGGGAGSVTSVTAGSGLSGGTITSSGTIAIAAGGVGTSHLADSSVTNSKLASGAVTNDKVVSIDWSKVTTVPTAIQNAGSDITALQNSLATTNTNLGTTNSNLATTNSNLSTTNSNLATTNTNVSNLTTAVNGKITQPASCTSGQLLSFVSVTDWTCVNAPSSSDKLPLAGGTMTGTLNMGAQAINNALSVQAGAVSTHTVLLSGTVPTTPPEGALWYDAGVLKYRGPSSDIAVGTAGSQWQDVSNGIASTKLLGVGNNLPVAGGYPNFHLSIDSKNDNVSARGINTSLYQTSTADGSYSNLAGVFKAQEVVSENVTNSGALSGLWAVAFRNNQPGFVDKGTLGELVGERIQYGHYNSEATATPVTTEAFGLKLLPYYRTGTIGTMYDFYSHPGAAGGAVTKHYGLYIAGSQKFNYLEGKLGVGTTTPTEALEVVGKVKATELCIGTNCISAWPSGASSGTVTQVNAGTGLTTTAGSTSSGGNVTTTGTLNLTNTGVTAGTYGSATSVPVFEVDAQGRVKTVTSTTITGAAPTGAASGDLGGTYPNPSVDKIKGQAVSATATADGQVLRFSGSSWTPSSVRLSELASSTGVAGSAFNATGCLASQTLNWSSITDKFECQNIASLNASVLTAGTIDNARLPASATYWQAATGGISYSSGNIGVGTSSPISLFHAEIAETGSAFRMTDSSAPAGYFNIGEGGSSANTFFPLISARPSGAARFTGFYSDAVSGEDTGTAPLLVLAGRHNGAAVTTRPILDVRNNTTSLMTMLADGSLGVGTTTPGSKLDVAGDIAFSGKMGSSIPANTNILMEACPATWTDLGVMAGTGPSMATCNGTACRRCQSPSTATLLPANSVLLVEQCPATWTYLTTVTSGPGTAGTGYPYSSCRSPSTSSVLPPGLRLIADSCPTGWGDIPLTTGGVMAANCTSGTSCRACEAPGVQGSSVYASTVNGRAALTVRDPINANAADAFQAYIQGADSQGAVNWYVGEGSSGKIVSLMSSNPDYRLMLGTNGLERLSITDAGLVGIGNTAPTERLEVGGNVQIKTNTPITSQGAAGGIRIFNTQSSNSDYLNMGWIAEDLQGIQSSDVDTHKNLAINPYGGNVGIGLGATAPTATLHVSGSSPYDISQYLINVDDGNANSRALFIVGTAATGARYGYMSHQGAGYTGNGAAYAQKPRATVVAGTDTNGLNLYSTTQIGTWIGNTEVMRATSTGRIGIGIAAPTQALDVVGNIKTSGCVYYASSSVGTCASDERIKKDVHSFDLGLDTLLGIDPVYFKYNGLAGFENNGEEQLGVIAQQVEKTAPQLIKKQMVQLHKDDKEKTEIKVVDYGAFTYVVINAVKELYAKVVGQEQQAIAQARQIASIESQKADKRGLAEANAKIKALEEQNAEKSKELDAMKAYLCAKDPSAPICK